ncbi:MAG: hypothetical protein IPO90_12235 [Flavobacteriales bacterium]|nr:hypothetical protein [Flavobacteriales bacterium]
MKLGQNIDVALTAQYLSVLMGRMPCNDAKHDRWLQALNKCTGKDPSRKQRTVVLQEMVGRVLLQPSFATNALESAQHVGADVDDKALEQARDFQKGNFDANTGTVATGAAAGVTLYAVGGSTRSRCQGSAQR